MKNYLIKLSFLMFGVLALIGCSEEGFEGLTFDSDQTGLGFSATSFNLAIPEEGLVVSVPVVATTTSASARTFTADVDAATTGSSANYSVGTVNIPAGSYNGVMDVTFNFPAALADGEVKLLVLTLVSPDDSFSLYDDKVTIEYFKEIICNDLTLTINTDFWASETTWEVVDASGVVVQGGGPYANGVATYVHNFNLPDGAYTLTFFDVYADGMFDGTNTGDYILTCSIITHATGGGAFGAAESSDFIVNP